MAEIPTIADAERTYTRIVDAARRQAAVELPLTARIELAKIYTRELDRVFLQLSRKEITEETARGLIRSIERALRRYMIQAQPEIKRHAFRAIKHVQEAHVRALSESVPLEISFSGIPQQAFEEMYRRRVLGVVDSFKTLRKHNAALAARQIERTLEATLLEGLFPQQAVERIAYDLAASDPIVKAAVEKYATGGGLKKFMRAGSKYAHVTDEAFLAAKRVASDSWRIVRTEMAAAALEGDRVSSIRSPVVAGMKWNLSPRHPKPDICDLYAKMDLHGMGKGVFPPELYPMLAHPHDLCFSTHTFLPPERWGESKPAPQRAHKASLGEVSRILSGITPKAKLRAWRQVRRDTARAQAAWEGLAPTLTA